MPEMQAYDWTTVPREELNPRFARQVIHGQTLTIARIFIKQGFTVPMHSHHNEQISMCDSGRLRFDLAGTEFVLEAGGILVIPPNVPHSAEALDDFVGTDIFVPCREDWRSAASPPWPHSQRPPRWPCPRPRSRY